ncbi:hypothetical protein PTKIN_Ptkin15bG0084700 [Pterospermum kingtungense]
MKFCKKYPEYMQGQQNGLPGVGFKKLKKMLKKCRRDSQSNKHINGALDTQTCPNHCPGSTGGARLWKWGELGIGGWQGGGATNGMSSKIYCSYNGDLAEWGGLEPRGATP